MEDFTRHMKMTTTMRHMPPVRASRSQTDLMREPTIMSERIENFNNIMRFHNENVQVAVHANIDTSCFHCGGTTLTHYFVCSFVITKYINGHNGSKVRNETELMCERCSRYILDQLIAHYFPKLPPIRTTWYNNYKVSELC